MLKAVCQISRGAIVRGDILPRHSYLATRAMSLAQTASSLQQPSLGPSAAPHSAHTRHALGCPLLPPLLHRPLGPRQFAARAKGRGSALQEAPPEPDALRMLDTELHVEAETSYIAYAMSVIVGRALPDVRDGLKPVHRRILYAMHDLGLLHSRPFRKCARVVGEVLGKYHPHGDTAVYDSLVRMAQDFTMQAPLIEGHGNFGSVDNDPPAAMRYTECRLRGLSTALFLDDLPFNTVDMSPTFDGSQEEPTVLPARVPHLLVNGGAGIAVGIATKIPPHNLREVVAALTALIKDPGISLAKLMKHMPAPDFPTGGEVVGADSIEAAFATGKGHITLRGIATVEQEGSKAGRGKKAQASDAASQRSSVVITQLPYQTNKAAMVATIANLIEKGTLTGISDVQDESDRDGMRVVLDVKRGFNPEVVRNALFQHTGLQIRFNANMVALVGGQPRLMGLKEMLSHFLDFRRDVVQRRSRFSLAKAQARLHTVEGLMKAQADMNTVVGVIRRAPDSSAASQQLQSALDLSPDQAESVLSMPLRRLTTLEAGKLQEEGASLSASIEGLVKLLASPEAVMQVVAQEAQEVAKKFGSPRRTQVRKDVGGLLSAEDILPNSDSLVVFSARGYLKRMPADTFTAQKRGGSGVAGTRLRDSDILEQVLHVRDHDHLLFFTPSGGVHTLRAHQVPLASRTAAGAPAAQVLGMKTGLNISAVLPVDEFRDTDYVLLLTRKGMLKKMPMSRLSNITSAGSRAIGLKEGDELIWVEKCTQDCSLLIGTSRGLVLQFNTDNDMVQPQPTRTSQGRVGMKLAPEDCIMGMSVLPAEVTALCSGTDADDSADLAEEEGLSDEAASADEPSTPWEAAGPCVLLVTEQGFGKLVAIDNFHLQKRALRGKLALGKMAAPDRLAALQVVDAERHDEVLLGTRSGQMVRVKLSAIPLLRRAARGVKVVKTSADDIITSCTPLPAAQADF